MDERSHPDLERSVVVAGPAESPELRLSNKGEDGLWTAAAVGRCLKNTALHRMVVRVDREVGRVIEDCAEVGGCTTLERWRLDMETANELATRRQVFDEFHEKSPCQGLGLGGTGYPDELVEEAPSEGVPLS